MANPLEKAEWGKSIIVCIRRYNKYRIPQSLEKFFGKLFLFEGKLNYSEEYTRKYLFEQYLKELGMRIYKDGVPARWSAVKAGLGRFRKNNFLYTKFCSWVYIDTWIVDAEMEYDSESYELPACPENCRRCIDACPTKALADEYSMDLGICIAQLSFYSSELPSKEMIEKMGTWIYGCDVCKMCVQ